MKLSASRFSEGTRRRAAHWAVGLTAALVLLSVLAPSLEKMLTTTGTRVIGGADLPIVPEQGQAWICNLFTLGLADQADAGDAPSRSRLLLYENDVPLRAHAPHDEVRRGGGAFSHWGGGMYFSTTDGSDPRTNGRIYRIVFPEVRIAGLKAVMSRLFAVSITLLVALGALGAVFPDGPWGQALAARRTAVVLLGLVAVALAAEVWTARARYGITPDSDSYTETPGLSSRPPAYYALMWLVADPGQVRAEVRELAVSGKSNTVVERAGPSQVWRVVFAQRVLLWAALCFAGVGLAALIGAPWAAAAIWVLGRMHGKVPDGTAWAWIITLLMLVPVAGALGRGRGWSRWRALPLLLLGLVTVPPVMAMALERSLMPGQVDLLMSETLAVTFVLMTLGALMLSCAGRANYWIVVAAAAAAAAYLTRPAAIYCLPVVGLAAVLQGWSGRRFGWRWPLAAGLVMVLALVLPARIKKWTGAVGADVSMLRWSLAAYALTVAESGDGIYMKNGDARFVFEACLPRRDQIRANYPIPAGLPYDPEVYRLGQYMYQVVLPVSQRYAEEKFPQDRRAQVAMWNQLLGDLALPLYRVHGGDLARIFFGSYRYMLQEGTRLTRILPFWGLLLGVAAMLALGWNRVMAMAGLCLAAHVLHLAVVCMFDQPLERYVYATEFCAVLGFWLVAAGASARGAGTPEAPK